jgi:hypothetical protein
VKAVSCAHQEKPTKMIDCLLLWFIQGNHCQNGVVVTEMTESVARSRKAATANHASQGNETQSASAVIPFLSRFNTNSSTDQLQQRTNTQQFST